MTERIVVVGATGAIGRPLCERLIRSGYQVVVFTRDAERAKQVVIDADSYVPWASEELSTEAIAQLGSADAVVYLAGAPLFDGRRHTRGDVEHETAARVRGIETLVTGLAERPRPGRTLISASSIGYYGYADRADDPIDESHSAGTDWWGQSSAAIERSAFAAQHDGIRTVVVRTAYVLTADSLQAQVAQFQRGFGGWIGLGQRWTPWIHIADEIEIIIAALERTELQGPLNASAPNPVRAREFARSLGRAIGHRAWLPVPTPLARMGLGVVTDIITRGKRVVPGALTSKGFRFAFTTLDDALGDLLSTPTRNTVTP